MNDHRRMIPSMFARKINGTQHGAFGMQVGRYVDRFRAQLVSFWFWIHCLWYLWRSTYLPPQIFVLLITYQMEILTLYVRTCNVLLVIMWLYFLQWSFVLSIILILASNKFAKVSGVYYVCSGLFAVLIYVQGDNIASDP